MKLNLKWDGEMRFVAANQNGVKVTLDTGTAYGGSGKYPTPMELLAIALGGCSAMDMVAILTKMRVELTKMDVEMELVRREEHPRYFEEIKMTYVIAGDGVTEDKARKAAELSNEKYCSVGIMLREKAKITWDIRIES